MRAGIRVPFEIEPSYNIAPDDVSAILANHSRLLTFGILFTRGPSGFTALIDAHNTAYDVSETRRYWKTRSLAIGLRSRLHFCLSLLSRCCLWGLVSSNTAA
jgi:uncharacterized BrkB/YihY/UPF0761 family membrane protein